MAQITTLPPQAYTRDTLVKAIDWVHTQNPTVRERANSADLIVSYYLQARRRADAQMEAPVSGENFKADLKHLAQDLRQFEDPSPPPTVLGRSFSPSRPEEVPPVVTQYHSAPVQAPPAPQPRSGTWPLDQRTLECARVVCARMNLSQEGEALRLLVTLGMERFHNLFP